MYHVVLKKIYIDPKTKELGFYLTLSIVRPIKTFNLCKPLVKLWKCQNFCQQHMMINSPCIQFFVRDKVISSKDHILEILQNQFNLIFWISNCIICFKSICSQGNCCGATGVKVKHSCFNPSEVRKVNYLTRAKALKISCTNLTSHHSLVIHVKFILKRTHEDCKSLLFKISQTLRNPNCIFPRVW